MRATVPLFLLVLLFSGCQDIHRSPKPEDLIPEDKMEDVLIEISLLNGARSYNKDLMEAKGIEPDKYIYEKFGIDSVQFVKSNEYYSEHYKQYQGIYTNVKNRLEALKVEYDSIRDREEKRLDSIRALEDNDTLRPNKIRNLKDSLMLKKIKKQDSLRPRRIPRKDTVIL